jgi:hypothetical protein
MSIAVRGGSRSAKIPAQAGIGLRFAHHRAVIEASPSKRHAPGCMRGLGT